MATDPLDIALVTEVFFDPDGPARLGRRLADAACGGASLAILPELPLNPWSAASKTPRADDAEPPGGPRSRAQSEAAASARIALVGGAIVADPADGIRRNTALVHDATGRLVAAYAKVHLPQEPGFWETSHYEPGREPPRPVRLACCALGVQICSDINRPFGAQLLAALGAEVIVVPRATEPGTYERWKVVFQATALTAAAWVVSVNRPRAPDLEVPIGGPSIVVDPSGRVVLETDEPLAVVRIDRAAVAKARTGYPGYLPHPADLYAAGWHAVGRECNPPSVAAFVSEAPDPNQESHP